MRTFQIGDIVAMPQVVFASDDVEKDKAVRTTKFRLPGRSGQYTESQLRGIASFHGVPIRKINYTARTKK